MSRSAEALSHPAAIIRLTLLLCCSAINPARTSLLCHEMIRSSKLQDRRLSAGDGAVSLCDVLSCAAETVVAALPTLKQEVIARISTRLSCEIVDVRLSRGMGRMCGISHGLMPDRCHMRHGGRSTCLQTGAVKGNTKRSNGANRPVIISGISDDWGCRGWVKTCERCHRGGAAVHVSY